MIVPRQSHHLYQMEVVNSPLRSADDVSLHYLTCEAPVSEVFLSMCVTPRPESF